MRNRSLLTSASLGAPSESFPRFILMPPPPPKPRFDMMTEQRACGVNSRLTGTQDLRLALLRTLNNVSRPPLLMF